MEQQLRNLLSATPSFRSPTMAGREHRIKAAKSSTDQTVRQLARERLSSERNEAKLVSFCLLF
jgi:hypothetical protein